MASSSTSSVGENFKYDVFLSFRGEDTRKTFVSHLYASLTRQGIHTFRDNEALEKGKRIDELFNAIKASKFFIIVFSQNYASSSWCLEELAKIMECQDTTKRIAYPLFYDVDPRDIRKQSGPVGEAIAKHKTDKQIKRWIKALKGAGNLVGWDVKKIANGHEAEAIDQIVKNISAKLHSICLSKDENLVGMESRMQDVELSLGKGLMDDEVRMIGIKGMGGIGKTTLARAIFNKISSQFEEKSFVDNVREASKERRGLLSLQKQVLKDILRDDSVNSFPEAISMMRDRMPLVKVLLVLDDVDDAEQLEALAGDWFKNGSRIIITTRDEQVLTAHGVNRIHNINCLPNMEAVKLFSRYAFKRYIPDEGFEKLSSQVVRYAAGLPLTLKVLGSSLIGKEKAVWKDTLNRLKEIPAKRTLDVLQVSYDGLEDDHQQIFLDVACFMKGMKKGDAITMLVSCGFYAEAGLKVLEDRSLITTSNDGFLGMHDSIEELGRYIVRRENLREPHKHSRLWSHEEIKALFSDDTVTEAAATSISIKWLYLSHEIIMKGLGKLKNLRLLHISRRHGGWRPRGNRLFDLYYERTWSNDDDDRLPDNWMFDEDNFSNLLWFLKWDSYPGRSLPQTFQADNLVGLELPNSRITKLWESGERKALKKLRFLNLSNSKLTTLDLGMTPNLERLDLQGCRDLTRLDVGAGSLKRIVYLNLVGSSSFRYSSFVQQVESLGLLSLPKLWVTVCSSYTRDNPSRLSFRCFYREEEASSLENSQKSVILNLQPCTKLETVSGSFFGLQHLRCITMDGPIPELPNDLDRLANLEELNLVSTKIKCLPDSICMLKHLKSLKIDSRFIEELPRDLGQLVCLEKLTLLSASIQHLPDSICMMKNLKSLQLQSCRLLKKLPRDLGQLECLEKLILIDCESLKYILNSICNMKRLRYFCLPLCKQVENLPEELGNLESLKVLDIKCTGISHLPHSISSLEGLCIAGSIEVLQSCISATKIQTSEEDETFCYIQAVDNTDATTGLENQFTPNFCNRHEHEAEAIDQIVQEISAKLRLIYLSKDENLVGMESRMQVLELSLGVGLDDEVRMIGIWGVGGGGKTTLAKSIFHKISSQFEGISFVENVREASHKKGLLSLQKQVLRDVLGHDSMNSFQNPISTMKIRMPLKKVLLVLDDVDHLDQLKALAGDWFKAGSRVIITTRDEHLLNAHRVNWTHFVSLLSDEEAMSLFSRYAFKRYTPDEGFEELSSQVVCYASGIPLTLKVLGSFLCGKRKSAWIYAIERLNWIPYDHIIGILRMGYDGLDDDQKEIFLDVACFMKGMLKEDAIRMLESRGFNAIFGLTVLEERSLITINRFERLGMHDLIEELGWHIVRQLHPDEPNKHSRLWKPEDIMRLFYFEGTEATATCIRLESADLNPELIMKGLGKLKNLSLLLISGRPDDCPCDNWMFDEANFPNSLRFLKWESYPGRSLPQTFRANNLVGLELPGSRITKLWESGEREVLSNLRFLNLRNSKLTTLDLGMTPNLEWLDLQGCHDLTRLDMRAGCLKRLVYLNLRGCSSFRYSLFIQQLESLELLSLPKLKVVVKSSPRDACDNLPKLSFSCFYFEKSSQKSVCLDLQPGTKLESVSGSIFGLQHLKHLTFLGCIPELPNDLDRLVNLEELKLVSTHIKCLPDSICKMKNLKSLKLESCQLLEKLPRDLGQLECLEKLILRECKALKDIPNSISNMKRLKVLTIESTGINHLPHSISSLNGLRITGSVAVLRSCASATKIQTLRGETFCYIQAVDNTEAETGLENQFTEKIYSNRYFLRFPSFNMQQE